MVCAIALSVALHGFTAQSEATVKQALGKVSAVTGNTYVIDNANPAPDLDITLSGQSWKTKGGQALAFTAGNHVEVFSRYLNQNGWGWESGISLGPVLLHELGHAYGLPHASTMDSIMYPAADVTSATGFSKGDKAALQATCH